MSFAPLDNKHAPFIAIVLRAIPLISLILAAAGCESNSMKMGKVEPAPVNSFTQEWTLPLNLTKQNDSIRGVYLRDDVLFIYTQRNLVVAINAASGTPLWSKYIHRDEVPLKAPIAIKDKFAFAGGASIEVFGRDGRKLDSLNTKRSVRSGGAPLGDTIYLGLDYPVGGRLAAMDLASRFDRTRWEYQVLDHSGIAAAPAIFQNIIYFATLGGTVTAVSEDKAAAWPLERSSFETDGPIIGDVKADEGGVFVASGDQKLYCLEGGTGRVRWQYYASVPLTESPVITKDTVYQVVPGVGVVALDKSQGEMNRAARWIVKDAIRFLSQDEKHVYLLGSGGYILGVDRHRGQIKARGRNKSLVAFGINIKTSLIYAATNAGQVFAIKPVTTPGSTGILLLESAPASPTKAPPSSSSVSSSPARDSRR